jgi:uncharacterized protein (DUF1800 family)
MTGDSAVALHRFGLGPRPGDLTLIAGDPRGALAADLDHPAIALIDDDSLPTAPTAFSEVRRAAHERKQMARANMDAAAMSSGGAAMDASAAAMRALPAPVQALFYEAEVAARITRMRSADIGFAERLVAFWTNHFAVQVSGNPYRTALAGPFEREAIRPHVLGGFEDMLFAATSHPAMLIYLNNTASVGPNSLFGQRRDRGLNENHARELLELHTVGVGAGYSQADVTALARILTGWNFGKKPGENYGRFVFREGAHEPGAQTVMGKTYDDEGAGQGAAVLHDLAVHPATAAHIAQKFARHFVADDPPASLVDRLASVFRETDGDLKALALALVHAEEAWIEPTKLKMPQEFLWSSIRALDVPIDAKRAIRAMRALGQPFWDPPSPEGFHDDVATWLAPNNMSDRLDFAERLASDAAVELEPLQMLDAIVGERAKAETRQAIGSAETRAQAFALLLMSSEFQRR